MLDSTNVPRLVGGMDWRQQHLLRSPGPTTKLMRIHVTE
jgi:hypothetical protein